MKWFVGIVLTSFGIGMMVSWIHNSIWWVPYVGAGIFFMGLDLFISAKFEKAREELVERIEALEKRIDPTPEYKDLVQIMDEMGI